MINICGCVYIPGAKQGMLELIPQTLFFLERARQYDGWVSGYPRLGDTRVIDFDYALEQLYHGRKRNVHLDMRNLRVNRASETAEQRKERLRIEDNTRK